MHTESGGTTELTHDPVGPLSESSGTTTLLFAQTMPPDMTLATSALAGIGSSIVCGLAGGCPHAPMGGLSGPGVRLQVR
jgi:hypothetical protein